MNLFQSIIDRNEFIILNKFKKEEKNISNTANTTQEEIETISKLYDSFQSELLNLKANYKTKTQIEINKFIGS